MTTIQNDYLNKEYLDTLLIQLPTEDTPTYHSRLESLSHLIQAQIKIHQTCCKEVINIIFPPSTSSTTSNGPPEGFELSDKFFTKELCGEIGLDKEVLRRMGLSEEELRKEESGGKNLDWTKSLKNKFRVVEREVGDDDEEKVVVE